MSLPDAEKEKSTAALSSVWAATFLTGLKITVGLWTGSLGILAEAAHSALDLVAAVVTLIAVRAAGRPADADHHYGHGKIENLSAGVEVILLLVTSGWIIEEAVKRLVVGQAHIDASIWAFAVLGVSIVVDITRSRMLQRAAEKHNSQALEADALHFSTDVWSSAVVVAGLVGVRVAAAFPAVAFLAKADAVAALGVAGIVMVVSLKLGYRTVQALLDATPPELTEKVKRAAEGVSGVRDCHAIRIRLSGPQHFVDLHILVDGSLPLDLAHRITEEVETAVQTVLPGADVTVHPEPDKKEG